MVLFRDLGLSEMITRAIRDEGLSEPSGFQARTIKAAVEKRVSMTAVGPQGSGKSTALAMAICEIVNVSNTEKGIQVCILCPRYALADEIIRKINAFGRHKGVLARAIGQFGQVKEDSKALRNTLHVIAAVPGLFVDYIKKRKISPIKEKALLVLDDLLDDSTTFSHLKEALGKCYSDVKQMWIASVVKPEKILSFILDKYDINFLEFQPLPEDRRFSLLLHSLHQSQNYNEKVEKLCVMLSGRRPSKVIVFCHKKNVFRLEKELKSRGFDFIFVHGGMHRRVKDKAIDNFRQSSSGFLVTSDFDFLAQAPLVIHFDLAIDKFVKREGHIVHFSINRECVILSTSKDKHVVEQMKNRNPGITFHPRT